MRLFINKLALNIVPLLKQRCNLCFFKSSRFSSNSIFIDLEIHLIFNFVIWQIICEQYG